MTMGEETGHIPTRARQELINKKRHGTDWREIAGSSGPNSR